MRATRIGICIVAVIGLIGCAVVSDEHLANLRGDGGRVGMDAGGTDSGRADAGRTDAGCGSARDCDDHNDCTADTCVEGGCRYEADDTLRCAGGSGSCTNGVCSCAGCVRGSVCEPGTASGACGYGGAECVSCDDGLSCTADLCAGTTPTCENLVLTGRCVIDGVCYEAGDRDPTNDCRQCAPGTTQTSWSDVASGAECTRSFGGAGTCMDDMGSWECCPAYGQPCDSASDCCSGVPCINRSCRYP